MFPLPTARFVRLPKFVLGCALLMCASLRSGAAVARRECQQDGEKEPDGDSLAIAQQCLLLHVCAPACLSIGGSAQILMNCLDGVSVTRFASESLGTLRSKKNLTIDLRTCC